MKSNQIFRSVAVAIILALLVIAIPATPALAATVTVTPTSGPVGTTINISGTVFTANNTYQITFAYGTTFSQSMGSGTVGGGGDIIHPLPFTVPGIPGGAYTIRIVTSGATGGEYASGTFTVTPKISLDETSGAVGDEVTVDGNGFAATSTITIYFINDNVGTDTTDANGTFADVAFIIPESYSGTHTVKVQDSSGNYANANLSTTESVTIAPTTGASGDVVTVSGNGFRARKAITVTFGNMAVTSTPPSITTDDYGSFIGSFTVPIVVNDVYGVKATDGTNQASANFTVLVGASVSQTTGNVGTEVTVKGTGFIVGAKVTITYDGDEIASATVDSNGAFTAIFEAPVSKHGSHTVVASDGTNRKQFTFTMESDPPPIPPPLLPEEGIKAETQPYFDWEDVDDPSGVTYTLQVATDKKFTGDSIILEHEGLTESEYTITQEEKLKSVKKEAPYYWRVMATDGASNESDWSTPGSFYIGFQWPELKGWLLYLLIGIGAVLFLGLGYWLGRRTSYY